MVLCCYFGADRVAVLREFCPFKTMEADKQLLSLHKHTASMREETELNKQFSHKNT